MASERSSTSHIDPYLSIVATARNDNHGGDLLRRMQLFAEGVIDQCDRFEISAELVLVDWNPPSDRPPLFQAIEWPAAVNRWCKVRVVEVPPRVHRRYKHGDALPLYQMIGKNVGIRRARGRFVLSTNIDVLFSDELMSCLAARRLSGQQMYRIDRLDVEPNVPVQADVQTRLRWCHDHVIRRHGKFTSLDLRDGREYPVAWKPTWRVRLLEGLQDLNCVPVVTRKRLHLNACGDFTLMAREAWQRIRGYPEFDMYSMHLDSVLCTQAYWSGLREFVFRDPMRMYHIEHGTGSGFTPEAEKELNERLARAGIPQLEHDEFNKWAIEMRRDRKPMMFNDETWGLSTAHLSEATPSPDQSKASPAASSSSLTATGRRRSRVA